MKNHWTNRAAHTVAATLLLSLFACGQASDIQTQSETKVTNGLSARNEFPSVVMLEFDAGQGPSICTGTFVNDSQVVTAAHCVYDIVTARKGASVMSTTTADGTRVKAVRLQYHPAYTVVEGALSNHDVAIVSFPRGTSRASTPLYPTTPTVGQDFTIVGFGLNDYRYDTQGKQNGTGAGVKREGKNKIAEISDGMIRFNGVPTASDPKTAQGQDSASGSGDSGGPLLINEMLAAVTSGGGLAQRTNKNGQTFTVKVSNYVNLNEPANRSFLARALVSTPGW